MGQLLSDSLLIFGFLAIVLAPLTLVLDTGRPAVQAGNSSHFFAVRLLRGSFFRLKSAHRACGMGSSVGMRDGHANNLISTRCVNPRGGSRPIWRSCRSCCAVDFAPTVYAFPSAANSPNSRSANRFGLRPLSCVAFSTRDVFTVMIVSFSITYDP
jgi:hypothetical protein